MIGFDINEPKLNNWFELFLMLFIFESLGFVVFNKSISMVFCGDVCVSRKMSTQIGSYVTQQMLLTWLYFLKFSCNFVFKVKWKEFILMICVSVL